MMELALQLPLRGMVLDIATSLATKVTAVVGPSGSGKTSLLEVIAGLRRDAVGRLVIDGITLLDSPRGVRIAPEKRQVGYVPQHGALFPHLDVRGNVVYGLRAAHRTPSSIDEVVDLLDLGALLSRYPRTLSGGEAQRVALARALVIKPRLLLLDEPLAALDADLKSRILPYLMRIRDRSDTPMLYVTHHTGEALALADEAIVLQGGRLTAQGPAFRILTPELLSGVHGEATFENIVQGSIVETKPDTGVAMLAVAAYSDRDESPFRFAVPASESFRVGQRATYRVASEDLLLLRDAPGAISARNLFCAEVTRVEQLGHESMAFLRAGGTEWRARVTPAAVVALELAPGRSVWVAIKTFAFQKVG